jgi:hypothetical protein
MGDNQYVRRRRKERLKLRWRIQAEVEGRAFVERAAEFLSSDEKGPEKVLRGQLNMPALPGNAVFLFPLKNMSRE